MFVVKRITSEHCCAPAFYIWFAHAVKVGTFMLSGHVVLIAKKDSGVSSSLVPCSRSLSGS